MNNPTAVFRQHILKSRITDKEYNMINRFIPIEKAAISPAAFKTNKFDDAKFGILPIPDSGEIISLCNVAEDSNNRKYLHRFADLDSYGDFNSFQPDQSKRFIFTNRNRIYAPYILSDLNFFGIWIWHASPNKNAPEKDYVKSRFLEELDAIELCNIDAGSLEELVKILAEKIDFRPHSGKTLFFFRTSENFEGVLCTEEQLITKSSGTALAPSCNELPVYHFSEMDVLPCGKFSFYRHVFAGRPCGLYLVRNPLSIVKDIISSSVSWSQYKLLGKTRKEHDTIKTFIDSIPEKNIIEKIAAECYCSIEDAENLFLQFLEHAQNCLDGKLPEDEIIDAAISSNQKLLQKATDKIRADWEKKNEGLMQEAERKLDTLKSNIISKEKVLQETQERIQKKQSELNSLEKALSQKEKLAEDIQKAVAEKIKEARKNTAEFMASMMFTERPPISPAESFAGTAYHICPESDDQKNLQEYASWEDVLDFASGEFEKAGVAQDCRTGLAAFLFSAYREKQPILLAGPNALDIAQAFCAAAAAKKHGVLCCEGHCDGQTFSQIGTEGERIVIIHNLLTGGWMNRLPEILAHKNIFYIAVHPYTEDIRTEPKSLFGSMLPLFTEFFVDQKASGNYGCGSPAASFMDEFETPSPAPERPPRISSKFTLSPLVRNRSLCLISSMNLMDSSGTQDERFFFAVLPAAYVSMETDQLAEALNDFQHISKEQKQRLKYILGDME